MKLIKPLKNIEYEKLDIFPELNLIRIRTETDGSCFFHALSKAFFKPYIEGKIEDKAFNRSEYVRNLRRDLSKKLEMKVNPEVSNSKTYYETISRGELPKISKELPELSLQNMQNELNSYASISNIYNEFISDQLGIDIYILDGIKKDVYMTGTDDDLLYKNRPSVVVLYLPSHYELVGMMKENKYIITYFSPNSTLIKRIRNRMDELRN